MSQSLILLLHVLITDVIVIPRWAQETLEDSTKHMDDLVMWAAKRDEQLAADAEAGNYAKLVPMSQNAIHVLQQVCVCVCVCERERERERKRATGRETKKRHKQSVYVVKIVCQVCSEFLCAASPTEAQESIDSRQLKMPPRYPPPVQIGTLRLSSHSSLLCLCSRHGTRRQSGMRSKAAPSLQAGITHLASRMRKIHTKHADWIM